MDIYPWGSGSVTATMRIAGLALGAVVAAVVALAVVAAKNDTVKALDKAKDDIRAKGTTADDTPTADLPIDWRLLSQAGGLAHEPYCPEQKIGLRVGDAELVWKTGDGIVTSRVSVFRSESLGIVVSYEGTGSLSLNGYVNDVDFAPTEPAGVLKGMLPEGVFVDHGFQANFLKTQEEVVRGVKWAMGEYGEKRVTVTGHSLGASVGQLAAVYLEGEVGIAYYLGFAPSRVGNERFADYVDKTLGGRFFYAINGADMVPRLPPRVLGYQHPGGQVWIHPANSEHWRFCSGQENKHCSLSVMPVPMQAGTHWGTYFHTAVGWGALICPAKVGKQGSRRRRACVHCH